MRIKKVLKEDTLGQVINDASKKLGDTAIETDEDELFTRLDACLEQAREAKEDGENSWVNLLLVGLAGIGKTSRLLAWGKSRGIKIVAKSASSMDAGDLGGALAADINAKKAIKLSTSELDDLDDEESVLFLDEFNRARNDVRGTFLTLIQDHWIPDASIPGGRRYLEGFLFTVAAINPSARDMRPLAKKFGWDLAPEDEDAFNTDALDDAEVSRFRVMYMQADPKSTGNFLYNKNLSIAKEAEAKGNMRKANKYYGRAELAKKILFSPKFSFDNISDIRDSKENGNGLQLNPRTFEMAINACDGTKKDFLDGWDEVANDLRKPEIEEILSTYTDKFDKANQVFKNGSSSEFFAKNNAKSAFNKMLDSGELDD